MITISIAATSDFSKVYTLIQSNVAASEEIIYDLRRFNFIEPIDIVLLTMSVIHFRNLNIKQRLIMPTRAIVRSYLTDIGLLEFIKTNYEQPSTINIIASRSAMPLRRITPATMNNYIFLAQTYFSQHCTGKDLGFLNITISELINNVNDHSNSLIDAYIFCQYYPRLNKIKVVVGDLGLGIPSTVNTFLQNENKPLLNDIETIVWALRRNNSTRSTPRNRGFGLDTLVGFIQSNRSIISIFSNSALYTATKDRNYKLDNYIRNFKGTIIQMEINVDNLPDIENIEEDFWELNQF